MDLENIWNGDLWKLMKIAADDSGGIEVEKATRLNVRCLSKIWSELVAVFKDKPHRPRLAPSSYIATKEGMRYTEKLCNQR